MFYLDCYDLNKKQIKEAREGIDSCNELLQLTTLWKICKGSGNIKKQMKNFIKNA